MIFNKKFVKPNVKIEEVDISECIPQSSKSVGILMTSILGSTSATQIPSEDYYPKKTGWRGKLQRFMLKFNILGETTKYNKAARTQFYDLYSAVDRSKEMFGSSNELKE